MAKKLKFLDLNTGNTYDGNLPYIHWFEGGRSTNLIHIKPIAFISEFPHAAVIMQDDDFNLINPENIEDKLKRHLLENVDDIDYLNINQLTYPSIYLTGEKMYEGLYVYIFYAYITSSSAAEFIDNFSIIEYYNETTDEDSIKTNFKIGADIYNSNEELYINSSNFGLDVQPEIQKAIYPVNVHESEIDNITMNRKMKELISNYWDIIANKGSYKSLINSLKWFEWHDILKLCEIWKHNEGGEIFYNDIDINPLLTNKYNENLNNFAKSTYLALYACIYKETSKFDDEYNPIVTKISSKWSYNDLSLKLTILSQFFEVYFMPIYLDLLQVTVENIIFSNNLKIQNFSGKSKKSFVVDVNQLNINIKNDDEYILNNIYVGVSPTTPMGRQYPNDMGPTSTAGFTHALMDINKVNPEIYDDVNFYLNLNEWNEISNYVDACPNFKLSDTYYNISFYEKRPHSDGEKMFVKINNLDGLDIDCTQIANGGEMIWKIEYYKYSNAPEPKFIDNIWDVKYVKDPSDDDLKTLYTQNYNGIGTIVDVECSAKLSIDDKLYKARILLPQELDERNKEIITTINTTDEVINNNFKKSTYKFKLLITNPVSKYNINIEFLSLNGLTYSVNRKIKIVDPYNLKLSIYQILPLPEEELKDNLTKYNINYPGTALFEKIGINTNVNYLLNVDDTQLNNMIVIESPLLANYSFENYLNKYYYTFQLEVFSKLTKGNITIQKTQILGISKKFGFHFGDKDNNDSEKYDLTKVDLKINKMILFPGFYKMVEYDTANPITNEMICIRPEWVNGMTNQIIEFTKKTPHIIYKYNTWRFENTSKLEMSNPELYDNIQSPFLAGNKNKLEPGYYDIIFTYQISLIKKLQFSIPKSHRLNSAICISDINND